MPLSSPVCQSLPQPYICQLPQQQQAGRISLHRQMQHLVIGSTTPVPGGGGDDVAKCPRVVPTIHHNSPFLVQGQGQSQGQHYSTASNEMLTAPNSGVFLLFISYFLFVE